MSLLIVCQKLSQLSRDTTEKALRRLKSDAQQIVAQVAGEETPEMVDDVWVRLIRHYVGQLRRYFHFRKNYKKEVRS